MRYILLLLSLLFAIAPLTAQKVVSNDYILTAAGGSDNDDWDGVVYPRPQQILSETRRIPLGSVTYTDPETLTSTTQFSVFVAPEAKNPKTTYAMGSFDRQVIAKLNALTKDEPIESKPITFVFGFTDNPLVIKQLGFEPELPEQGYIIKLTEESDSRYVITCAGADQRGLFYGMCTLKQMMKEEDGKLFIEFFDVIDYPFWPERYTSEDHEIPTPRALAAIAKRKIGDYAWQYRRYGWRNFGTTQDSIVALNAMKRLHDNDLMNFMLLLHIYVIADDEPVFNIADDADIKGLIERCRLAAAHGITRIMICVDDHTPRRNDTYVFQNENEGEMFGNSVGRAHGYLMTRLHEALSPEFPDLILSMVGAPYALRQHGADTIPSIAQYIIDWSESAPKEVFWVWTGPLVCSKNIVKEDHEDLVALLQGQMTFVWDNSNCFNRPMPRWNTKLYPELVEDSFGIFYMNCRILSDSWMLPYALTANDYLWNPNGFDPEVSYRTALKRIFPNDEDVDKVLHMRKLMIPAQAAFAAADRAALTEMMPALEEAFAAVEALHYRNGTPVKMGTVDAERQLIRDYLRYALPRLEIERRTTDITIDGVINAGEWAGATEFQLIRRDGEEDAHPVQAYVVYDDRGLYFAFNFYNPGELPDLGDKPHDSPVFTHADHLSMLIQPSPAGGYGHYSFDYAGNKFEEPNDRGYNLWDPDWQLKTTRTADGWAAEAFLPTLELEQFMPTKPAPGVLWRANFHRFDTLSGHGYSWNPGGVSFHLKQFFGELVFK